MTRSHSYRRVRLNRGNSHCCVRTEEENKQIFTSDGIDASWIVTGDTLGNTPQTVCTIPEILTRDNLLGRSENHEMVFGP